MKGVFVEFPIGLKKENRRVRRERRGMDENAVGQKVLGCALKVHRTLGPGLLESAYEACLAYECEQSGLSARRQVPLPVRYGGVLLEVGYRLDLVVQDIVVVEVKAVERLNDVHRAQLISYLKL